MLELGVGDGCITGSEVRRRHTVFGKSGNIGPTELCSNLEVVVVSQTLEQRMTERRWATVGAIDHLDEIVDVEVLVEKGSHPRFCLVDAPVGRVSVVDAHDGTVGNHVAGDAALDVHDLQRFDELTTVDDGFAGLVGGNGTERTCHTVDGVAPHPRASRVGPCPGEGDLESERTLATCLDRTVGWLTEDGAITFEQVGPFGEQFEQPVVLLSHFFTGIEHEGEVKGWFADRSSDLEETGEAAFHVGGPDTPERVVLDPSPTVRATDKIVGFDHGNRVGVSDQKEALFATELGAGHQIVADAVDMQVIEGPEFGLEPVDERALLERDRGVVDEFRGESKQVGHGRHGIGVASSVGKSRASLV